MKAALQALALGVIMAAPAVLVTQCQAAEVGVHLVSYHLTPGMRNTNPGIYVAKDGWVLGAYANSVHRDTVYLGRYWELGPLRASAVLASGYRAKGPMLLVSPSVLVFPGVRVHLLPSTRRGIEGAHLSLERSF